MPEFRLPNLKHGKKGTISMACAKLDAAGTLGCAAQFFLTLADDQTYLDGAHVPFGQVVEGLDTLDKINESFTDERGRPLRDIRIRHVIVLDEGPWGSDFGLNGLVVPPSSPVPTPAMLKSLRVGDDEDLERTGVTEEQKEQERREADARAQALTLEMVGDLPFADVKVPEASLFVCKLNSVTTSEDLEIIFSRFGNILSCEVITDKKSGDSLNYAFIEFEKHEDAERAFIKMEDVLIDDRRIHVDFSQSVAKLHNAYSASKAPRRQAYTAPDIDRGGDFVFDQSDRQMSKRGNDRRENARRRSRSPPRRRHDR